jgi:hypothetical protein
VTLEAVSQFSTPIRIVEQTEEALRRAGREGFELFVLWSGTIDGTAFRVSTAHAPAQDSHKTDTGLLVRIEGEALHTLNSWLYEHSEMLGVQVHAHPDEAYHSETDDSFPIVSTIGGLSIVVPDFARNGLLAEDTAAYRLSRSASWDEVELADVLDVIR